MHPLSHGERWQALGQGCWVQLLSTCSHGPLGPSPGDALGADGPGSLAIRSQHSCEPTISACLPVERGARRGAWGTVLPVLRGPRVVRCC